jgi:predicted CopG family antitoxin
MAYLYRHIRLDKNEPFYIGIGSDKTYSRSKQKTNRNKYWQNIVKLTTYEIEILLDDLTWEEVCKKEIEFIKLYGRKDLNKGSLCNCTNGGEGVVGLITSEETKNKIRIANTGKKQPLEQIQKRSLKLSGAGNPWYGKKFSEEYKKKLSDAKKGKKRNSEVMKKLHESRQKKVIDLSTNKTYNSIKELAIFIGKPACTISRWLKKPNSKYKII